MNKNLWIFLGVLLVLDGSYGASITRTRRTDEETQAVLDTVVPEVPVVESLKQEPVVVDEVVKEEEIAGRNAVVVEDAAPASVAAPVPEQVQSNVPVQEKLLEIEQKSVNLEQQPTEYVDALKLVSTEDKVEGVSKVVENVMEALKTVPQPAPALIAPETTNEVIQTEARAVPEEKPEILLIEEPKKEILDAARNEQPIAPIEEKIPEAIELKQNEILEEPKLTPEQPMEVQPAVGEQKSAPTLEEPKAPETPLVEEPKVPEIISEVKAAAPIMEEPKKEEEMKIDEMPKEEMKPELLKNKEESEPMKEIIPEEATRDLLSSAPKVEDVLAAAAETAAAQEQELIPDEQSSIKRIDTHAENLEYVDTKLAKEEIIEKAQTSEIKAEEKVFIEDEEEKKPEEPIVPQEQIKTLVEEPKPEEVKPIEKIEEPKVETQSEPKSLEPSLAPVQAIEPVVQAEQVVAEKQTEEVVVPEVKVLPEVKNTVEEEQPAAAVGIENLKEKPQVPENVVLEGKSVEPVEVAPVVEEVKPVDAVKTTEVETEVVEAGKSVDPKLDNEPVESVPKQTTSAPNVFQSVIQNALGAIGLAPNSAASDQASSSSQSAEAPTTARPNIIQQFQAGIQNLLGNNQATSTAAPAPAAADEPAPTTARPSGIIATIQNAVNSTLNRPSSGSPGPFANLVSNILGNQPSTGAPAAPAAAAASPSSS